MIPILAVAAAVAYLFVGALVARTFFGRMRASDIDALAAGDFRFQPNPATRAEMSRERWNRDERDGTMFAAIVCGCLWPFTGAVAGAVWFFKHPVAGWLDSAPQRSQIESAAYAAAREAYIAKLEAERTPDPLDVLADLRPPVLGQVPATPPPPGGTHIRGEGGRLVDVRTFADGGPVLLGALCMCGLSIAHVPHEHEESFVEVYANPKLISDAFRADNDRPGHIG